MVSLKILLVLSENNLNKKEFIQNNGFKILLKLKPSSFRLKNLIYSVLNSYIEFPEEIETEEEIKIDEFLPLKPLHEEEKKPRKNSENIGTQIWKMAKGSFGIFGLNTETDDESVEEIEIDSKEENFSDAFSEHHDNIIEDGLTPSYEYINKCIQNLKRTEEGIQRSAIFEILKEDLKQVSTENLEILKKNSLYLRFKNSEILEYHNDENILLQNPLDFQTQPNSARKSMIPIENYEPLKFKT